MALFLSAIVLGAHAPSRVEARALADFGRMSAEVHRLGTSQALREGAKGGTRGRVRSKILRVTLERRHGYGHTIY